MEWGADGEGIKMGVDLFPIYALFGVFAFGIRMSAYMKRF